MDIINKIDMYSYTHDEFRDMQIMLEIAMFIDTDVNQLNEGIDIKKGMKSIMHKMGLHAHKTGDGLIAVMLKAGKTLGEFFWHLFQASLGNEESKIKAKELANKEIKKEQVVDFLLKLDMATLHLITGPLHMLDAITGWHIGADIHSKAEDAVQKAKSAIKNLIDAAKTVESATKDKIKKLMQGLVRLFGLTDEHKLVQAL